jgi:plasmid stabilization system protein ParE
VKIRFLSRASDELAEAVHYYNEQRPGLGNELLSELDSTLATMEAFPSAWPVIRNDVRRALLARFPYAVLYRANESEITVAAFMDLRSDPKDIDTV